MGIAQLETSCFSRKRTNMHCLLYMSFILLPWISSLFPGCYGVEEDSISGTSTSLQEYCQWETFNASCNSDEVILMTSANYGRMNMGRCLKRDYGYIGCAEDVLPFMDKSCSGLHSCTVSIPNPVLDKIKVCPGDLKAYLEAGYTCVKVETAAPGKFCGSDTNLLQGSKGYIASVITESTDFGSALCPWTIRAKEGQRITVSLLDFAIWSEDPADLASRLPELSGVCHIYSTIKEHGTTGSVTLCGGEKREKIVYTSETNEIEVTVARSSKSKSHSSNFLLKYEVTGCEDPKPPLNVKIERAGPRLLATCQTTRESWELICEGNEWKGVMHDNCTSPAQSWSLSNFIEGAFNIPQGLLIVIIIAIALLIAFLILLIGILSLRRHRQQNQSPSTVYLKDADTGSTYQYVSRRGTQESHAGKEQYPMLANPERVPSHTDRDYTTTWQRNLHIPATSVSLSDSQGSTGLHSPRLLKPGPGMAYPQTHFFIPDMSPSNTMSSFRPNVEHIYESPKFERKNVNNETSVNPFYHELEREQQRLQHQDSGSSQQGDFIQWGQIRHPGHPTQASDGLQHIQSPPLGLKQPQSLTQPDRLISSSVYSIESAASGEYNTIDSPTRHDI